LILGTAQLGLNYGISNKKGQPNIEQAREILETAHNEGIRILDTASAYGDAEKVIGELNQNRFEIISKLPDLSKIEFSEDYSEVSVFLQKSLENTQQQQLCAYLLHSIENLKINGEGLWRRMQDFKEQGLAKKIGYSLYSPKQLDLYFDQYKPDIVQIPMNILDREFQKTGWLKKLKDNGVEIHVRSVFLQGLLLMEYENQVLKFPLYKHIWDLLLPFIEGCELHCIKLMETPRIYVEYYGE
jgi:aryl-alcohol dehydrogenase-like predicted oxidoreductase